MLTTIKIKNFRLFKELEVKRLGRITLLVGKNNSGKSSFLEALLLYLNMPSKDIVSDLLELRQDVGNTSKEKESNLLSSSVRHLFYKHLVPNLGEGVTIKVENVKNEESALEILRVKDEEAQTSLFEEISEHILLGKLNGMTFPVWFPEEHYSSFLSQRTTRSLYRRRNLNQFDFSSNTIRFISTNGLTDRAASRMWDAIALTDEEGDIVKVLGIIEPLITKITFVENQEERSADRLPIVKIRNINETITLRSLGDGVTKLFHILISIANAKDGTLLIDEFENGFHWSVQEKVWTAVFDLAEKLNVQVFATTHSRDCVQAFSKVWSQNEEAGAFIRLENNEGVVRAEEYNSNSLARSIRAEVEVR